MEWDLLTRTFVFVSNPGVHDHEARDIRGLNICGPALFLGGPAVIPVVRGRFLVISWPWHGRVLAVVGGWVAMVLGVALVLPFAMSLWQEAERATVTNRREIA